MLGCRGREIPAPWESAKLSVDPVNTACSYPSSLAFLSATLTNRSPVSFTDWEDPGGRELAAQSL